MAGSFWASSHYEQWILDKAEIKRGRSDDLAIYNEDEYQKLQIFFSNFIQSLALDQQIAQTKTRMQVIATAIMYFKRFYSRRSFKDIDPFLLAPTCVLLASKVEEHGIISTTKLLTTATSVMKKMPALSGVECNLRVPFMHEAEFILIEIMDCSLIVYQPYRSLSIYLQDLARDNNMKDFDAFQAQSWRVCNDSLRSDCGLMFPPYLIALACITVASLLMNREKDIKQWLIEINTDVEKIGEPVQVILNMYKLMKTYDEKDGTLKALIEKLPKPQAGPPPQGTNSSGQPAAASGPLF